MEKKEKNAKEEREHGCSDRLCPVHGTLRARGRTFKGAVEKIVGKRAVIAFDRFVYYPKYQRYTKGSTKLHAHIPACLESQLKPGIKIKIQECRPISKIIHFVVIEVEKQ
jgi:small subunit ribosomal protein S17